MSATGILGACALGLVLTGCAGWQASAKTVDQAALIACKAYFGAQKPALSPKEVARVFCSAAEDVAPFILAVRQAGALSASRHAP